MLGLGRSSPSGAAAQPLRPRPPHVVPPAACAKATHLATPLATPQVSPALRRKVAGLALAFCLSVTCGNVALRFIYVSFAQVGSRSAAAATPQPPRVIEYDTPSA